MIEDMKEYQRNYYLKNRDKIIKQVCENNKRKSQDRREKKINLMVENMNLLKQRLYDNRTLKKYNIIFDKEKNEFVRVLE